jgi:hypothetical protein
MIGSTLVVASLALAGCGSRDAGSSDSGSGSSSDKVAKIGVIAPLSGDLSALGLGIQHSVELAVKEANEKKKLTRATVDLATKVSLTREAKALQSKVDDLQHQLYTRLKEIDAERDRMLDDIADQLALTPEMTPLFTIRWSLA